MSKGRRATRTRSGRAGEAVHGWPRPGGARVAAWRRCVAAVRGGGAWRRCEGGGVPRRCEGGGVAACRGGARWRCVAARGGGAWWRCVVAYGTGWQELPSESGRMAAREGRPQKTVRPGA
ncbi:hypothetical protein GCM10007977_037100 [Dactylosporangium sucinum]|uniref:Uncharacterized protein n=1 Tax=Dactylosporangium sucinum TaxID=1424081 RepID=A0A917WUZ4_9ACTN|nr:hypothetical protein GCM10007977_037100 [Dactylosporangium sucinum]